MIPDIGVMLGAYITFRCVEVLCKPETAFSSTATRSVSKKQIGRDRGADACYRIARVRSGGAGSLSGGTRRRGQDAALLSSNEKQHRPRFIGYGIPHRDGNHSECC